MLKTYRIIPLVFILFLFGFTLFTVSPVFAWDPSMGMRHPDRPCMNRAKHPGGCGPDRRSPEQKASDPYDTNNPASQAARANPAVTEPHAKVTDGPWDPSMGMRHPARPCMKNGLINPSKGCGPDNRASAIIARDPYDKEYIILKRAAPALEQACFRRCEGGPTNNMSGGFNNCKASCVSKRPNPRCKYGSFSGFYTTESSLRCLN